MFLEYEDCIKNPEKAFSIQIENINRVPAFIGDYNENEIIFSIYKNNKSQNLIIPKSKMFKYNILYASNFPILDENFPKDFFNTTILSENRIYKTKLLGYCEHITRKNQCDLRKIYFYSHGIFSELTCYSPGFNFLSLDSYISYKQSTNIKDFTFTDNNKFYLFSKDNKPICIKKLVANKMLEISEIANTLDKFDKENIEFKRENMIGVDFDSAILLCDDRSYVSKLYVNSEDFTPTNKKNFVDILKSN